MDVQYVAPESVGVSSDGPGNESGWVRIVRRFFSRHLMDTSILLLLPMILSGLRDQAGVLMDPDIWWHLADARILCDLHHFIRVDPYSFTVAGKPWVNPEWLSEIPFWFGYKGLGLVGIYLVAWLGVGANALCIYWRSYWKTRNAGVALWVSALGFILMWVNANSRTILFGYLALSAELAILESMERSRVRVLWLLPPVFCVWINLHGSWFIGMGLFVLYIGCGVFSVNAGIFLQEKFSREQIRELLTVLGASVAALFINPYGWRLVWNPLDMLLNQKLNIGNVVEWQPLNLEWFVGKAAIVAIGLTILANVMHAKKWKIHEFAFVFFAWYAAFDHARFTFLASVITMPVLAADLTRSFFPAPPQRKTIPAMNAIVAAGVLGVVALYFPHQSDMQKEMSDRNPMQTIGSIGPKWRTLNSEGLGGLMAFNGKSDFIDTRWDIFEHQGIMKDFIDIVRLQNTLGLLDKYRIDHVLMRKNDPLSYLLEHLPAWRIARTEGSGDNPFVLFARRP